MSEMVYEKDMIQFAIIRPGYFLYRVCHHMSTQWEVAMERTSGALVSREGP